MTRRTYLPQGLRGPNHSCSTACATGAHSLGEGLRLLQHGAADAMVCGGVDAAISPLGMLGFASARCVHDLLVHLDFYLKTNHIFYLGPSARPLTTRRRWPADRLTRAVTVS